MKNPWLIQRCEISEGKLEYDYMGSAEFEFGACPKSLKHIFSSGLTLFSSVVQVNNTNIPIFVVAGKSFNLSEYRPHLQQLAEHKLRLQERSEFDEAIKQQLGIKLDWDHKIRNNAWFDIENDVLWTLTEENQKLLLARLEHIKKEWAEKETAKK